MRVLVLGGTGEARELAARLTDLGVGATTSLAGAVQRPARPAGEVRIGGFDGVPGLIAYLRSGGFDAVVDATHPFAATITLHAAAACATTSTPLLVLRRPGWIAGAGDRWTRVASIGAAAAAVRSSAPATVFLTTGRSDLAAFADDDVHAFVVRSVDPPTGSVPTQLTVVLDRGPFTLDGELAQLRAHDVRLLVTKDSGGPATVAKLDAARLLEVPVIMVDRPALPEGVVPLDSVGAVLTQLRSLLS